MVKCLSLFFLIMFLIPSFINCAISKEVQAPVQYTILSTKYDSSTPFWIKIGGEKYYFIRSKADGNYSYKDLLGCDKSKKQLFEPFYELNRDDFKLTSKELADGGIRLVREKLNGTLEVEDKTKDFALENISYIDMTTIATFYDRFLRPSGNFTMYVISERGNMKKYIGHTGFVPRRFLERMFK